MLAMRVAVQTCIEVSVGSSNLVGETGKSGHIWYN